MVPLTSNSPIISNEIGVKANRRLITLLYYSNPNEYLIENDCHDFNS